MGAEFGTTTTVVSRSKESVFPDEERAIPCQFVARVEVEGAPLVATLRVAVDTHGRAVCESLRLDPAGDGPVTAVALRMVRVAELLRVATAAATEKVRRAPDGVLELAPMTAADALGFRDKVKRRRRRATPADDDALREVASVYEAAAAKEEPPLRAVVESCHVSRSTASRMIAEARRRGLLAPPRRNREEEA